MASTPERDPGHPGRRASSAARGWADHRGRSLLRRGATGLLQGRRQAAARGRAGRRRRVTLRRWSTRRARRPRARRPQRRPQPPRIRDRRRRPRHRPLRDGRRGDRRRRRNRLGRDRRDGGQVHACHRREGARDRIGDTGSVGVGGITLAGGIGFLARKTGLTIDSLLAAEVVTADGEVVEASEDSMPDLFWAIRGGEKQLRRRHPAPAAPGRDLGDRRRHADPARIAGGDHGLPRGRAGGARGALHDRKRDDRPADAVRALRAHGKPVVMGLFAYAGPVDQGER